jgi:hypothetical protein
MIKMNAISFPILILLAMKTKNSKKMAGMLPWQVDGSHCFTW